VDDFDQFFFEHYVRVVGSLRLAGGEAGETEDAAQEAFAKAMVRWNAVSVMERPATWVYVVALRSSGAGADVATSSVSATTMPATRRCPITLVRSSRPRSWNGPCARYRRGSGWPWCCASMAT
jgi:hypothetical protein